MIGEDYLDREDAACKCGCGFNTIDYRLWLDFAYIKTLVEQSFGLEAKVNVHCVCRCPEHNETVQKKYVKDYVPFSSKSTHKDGKAIDFDIEGVENHLVYDLIDKEFPYSHGLACYGWGLHFDARDIKWREVNT